MKSSAKATTVEAAIALLPACKTTTLDRMRDAAFAEVSRIEASQLSRIVGGFIAEPMPCQMVKRDDFLGLVRLLDRILSDQVILDRLKPKAPAIVPDDVPAATAAADDEIIPVDEETTDT